MRDELKVLCEEFIQDRDMAKDAFAWENSYILPVCAGILADKKETITVQRLKECKQIIKDKTGIFSDFRGTVIAPMACMLAISDNAETLFNNALKVYEELKKHFHSSTYLPLVSMIVAQMTEESQYPYIAQKTREIYNLMKKEHPFLTSNEDGPFAAMLAFSDYSPELMMEEVEKCYEILKPKFFSGNAVQSLSHVLALGEGSAKEKCQRLVELFEALKEKGYKYGTDCELTTLGALSILPCDMSQVVTEIVEVAEHLEKEKGYGFFGASQKQRLMHAVMIVCKAYVGKKNSQIMNSAAISSTIAIIAAQQAAICAAVAVSAAASSASN